MDAIIVGAGPTGLTLGAALARRRHRVLAVDRDPGPSPDGTWRRRGVMQFEHPHGFRPQVRDLLVTEWPEAWRAWLALGAEPIELGAPSSRPPDGRALSPAHLRAGAATGSGRGPRAHRQAGHVDGLVERGGASSVPSSTARRCSADLVVDAGGRLSRLAPPAQFGGDTGMAYVTRTYRARPGRHPGTDDRPRRVERHAPRLRQPTSSSTSAATSRP